ncbi:phage head completion protein [Niallia taxi]|uniref:phage head completion protein n=1 Tax=Niallia taxi TaxID=2499688 RepID=UPI00255198F7|nr:head-tail adaptor protein [Niallia taxi]MDK8641329.1 head-tail adaptor protein [Niallia taxi]
MPKRQTNKLKWKAELMGIVETTDHETDRPKTDYVKIRDIRYNNLGVTSTDKIFAERDTNEVVKKIETRIDRAVENHQKEYRVSVGGRTYNIERIYVKEADRLMEVSLSYAD